MGTAAAGGGHGGGGRRPEPGPGPGPGLDRARRGLQGPQCSRPFLAESAALAPGFPPLRAAVACSNSSLLGSRARTGRKKLFLSQLSL